jgi:hypothetical protein
MAMKKIGTAIAALIVLACLGVGKGFAVSIAYPKLSIREQVNRADYALHARVLEIKRLGKIDSQRPVGPCGILIKVSVLEQFKGAALPDSAWFATHQILFPEKPLKKGDVVLALLRDVERDHGVFDEALKNAYASVRSCAPEASSLYLAVYEENLFPIVAEKTGGLWLEHGGRTEIPRSVEPKLKGVCRPLRDGGCVVTQNPAVAWQPLREELRSWSLR